MKRLLILLLLGAAGYWIGTGDAATEWRAFRFWYGNREALPMLEARATWALDEIEAALPLVDSPVARTRAELDAFAEGLKKGGTLAEEFMAPSIPHCTKEELEAHRARSASLQSYGNVREAAASASFHQVTEEHMALLGKRLDSGHVITVWQPMAEVVAPPEAPGASAVRHALGWQTALNLSTRERLGSMPHVRQLEEDGD